MELTPKFSKAPWMINGGDSRIISNQTGHVCIMYQDDVFISRSERTVNSTLIKTAPKLWQCLYKIINCDNMCDSMEIFEEAERLLKEANGEVNSEDTEDDIEELRRTT